MAAGTGLPDFLEGKAAATHWARLGWRKRFGVCTPLASVRSSRGCGVGDFADIERVAEWANACGATLVQVLPLNDMGTGCVPYAAVSAFALDPIYTALDQVEAIQTDAAMRRRMEEVARALNVRSRVDYAAVRREKGALLDEAWRRSDGPALRAILDEFEAQNPWIGDYALFRVIREIEGYRAWEAWCERYDPARIAQVRSEHSRRIERIRFEQWLLDRQLREAVERARARGVRLIGDIPILVARDSADVFAHRELFLLDTSAGAPPDMYAQDGQNWGFPTYHWPAHRETGFAWWRSRLRHAERYFDLYRVDHVVGFFRIWTIPLGERTGRNGRFVPEDEALWGPQGREILEMMLETTRMLPLAEDLGTIPPVCRQTLHALGICGLKIQRWERDWERDRRFLRPEEYAPLSVAMLSTHDSETFAGWWEAFPEDRQRLYETLGGTGAAPERLDPALHARYVQWLSAAGSIFYILMVQDLLWPLGVIGGDPAEHRINVPGVVNDTNWTWRWPVDLERLLEDRQGPERVRAWIGPERIG